MATLAQLGVGMGGLILVLLCSLLSLAQGGEQKVRLDPGTNYTTN